MYKNRTSLFKIFEENSRKIKSAQLGGPASEKSKLFTKEFNNLKEIHSHNYKNKEDFIKSEIGKSQRVDTLLKTHNVSMESLYERECLK
jgi:hypothetical protein